MPPIIPSVSVAVWREDRVFLVTRARPPYDGALSLPGGKMKFGETAEQAAERELFEETGMVATDHRLADVADVMSPEKQFVIMVFAARWLKGEPALNDEASSFQWSTLETIKGATTTPGLSVTLKRSLTALAR